MAFSNPSITSAAIPTEAQPNNRFTFEVTVRQDGPDPWASDGSCTSANLDIAAWKTPIRLMVDGEQVDETELCLASGNTKTGRLSASLSEGQHELNVVVDSVGGNAYDLKPMQTEVNDDVSQTVSVSQDASDPSRPSSTDKITRWFQRLADALGGTTQQIAFGMVLAAVVLVVL